MQSGQPSPPEGNDQPTQALFHTIKTVSLRWSREIKQVPLFVTLSRMVVGESRHTRRVACAKIVNLPAGTAPQWWWVTNALGNRGNLRLIEPFSSSWSFFVIFLYKEAAERPRGDRRGGEAAWSSSSVTEELPAAASTTS